MRINLLQKVEVQPRSPEAIGRKGGLLLDSIEFVEFERGRSVPDAGSSLVRRGVRDAAEDLELPNVPDIILPSQFFQSAGARQFSSEQRLMLAVLTDAVNILRGWRGAGRSPARQIYNETTQWCFAPDNGAVFSFESVCGALRIDPAVLRRRLRADVRRGLGKRAARGRLRLKEANRPQRVGFTDRRRHHAVRPGHREPSLA